MNTATTHRVIMFADVAGSTALYEARGDEQAQRLVDEALEVARQATSQYSGKVLTELGDEIMATFTDPGDAAAAACSIHAKIAESAVPDRLRMRIGLHYGPFSGGSDELVSETAKIAHWTASNAKADQTLGTAALIDVLPGIYRAVSRYVDDETWNFVSVEHVALHEIVWNVENVTAYSGEIPTLDAHKCSGVSFSYPDKTLEINVERPVISIGRGHENDLIVNHDMASRQHLRAQFSRGRCTISDNSTNGTVVFPDGGQAHYALKRESHTLLGAGLIILGEPDEVEQEFAIRYRCL